MGISRKKRRNIKELHRVYRRPGKAALYARDRYGRYNVFKVVDGKAILLPSRKLKLPPDFFRVDFSNQVRFTGRVRGQRLLKIDFERTFPKLTSLPFNLPRVPSRQRRAASQGMQAAMLALTGDATIRTANEYVAWYNAHTPRMQVDASAQWEWCHLRAHSMGGAEAPANVVAAVKGNNSEQLAIENVLSMYRAEEVFEVEISAVTLNQSTGRHLGNVIRYQVRPIGGGGDCFDYYLDCLNAPAPSSIHFYNLVESLAKWANRRLEQIGPATVEERKAILHLLSQQED
jgi:hypothetical protein